VVPLSRIVFYLLQFYLFACSGALAYLSLRAWYDPDVAGRLKGQNKPIARLAHMGRAVAFLALTVTWLMNAVNMGDVPAVVSFGRIVAIVALLALFPRALRTSKNYIAACALLLVGEALRYVIPLHTARIGLLIPLVAFALIGGGLSLLGFIMKGSLIRLRVMDRLVISFAVSSMLITQLIVCLFLVLDFSIGDGMTSQRFVQIVTHMDKPVMITLTTVIAVSSIVGYILARDISAPMERVEEGIRAVGEGDLDYRVELRPSADEDVQDLAREVNRMAQRLKSGESVRTEFFSFVSHELRSPLTSIRGFVQTLQADPSFAEDDRQEIYNIIAEESDRLLRMISEYLDVARMQAGRPVTLNIQRFDCGRHLDKVVEIMRNHAKKHELVVSRPAKIYIEADPDRFDQVLINLLSNAIKYSPKGGKITASLRDYHDHIEISVEDNGLGMTEEQTEKVFDKFYRVSDEANANSTLAKIEGSGIGLYLTRSIIESHGGSISVKSKLGQGSTFTVSFPKNAQPNKPVQPTPELVEAK